MKRCRKNAALLGICPVSCYAVARKKQTIGGNSARFPQYIERSISRGSCQIHEMLRVITKTANVLPVTLF
jgi:hypothetical protein